MKENILNLKSTLLEAIQLIDRADIKVALVLDTEKKLCGVVTDGDIRRSLLRGMKLQSPIKNIMNSNPKTVLEDTPQEEMIQFMRKEDLLYLPVLNTQREVQNLFTLKELHSSISKDNWVILMAGGAGKRLLPLTQNTPKPLLQVGNKPILETILKNFIESGYKNFFLSINYQGQKIQNHFGDGNKLGNGVRIEYLKEEQALGTAGSLSLLKERPQKPFIVMNGDLLTKVDFEHLLDFHLENQADVTLCIKEYQFSIPFGVVNLQDIQVRSLYEKPIQTHWINGGIYVLSPELLDKIAKNTYLDMTTLLKNLLSQNKKVCAFPIREYWLDIGQPQDFIKADGDYTEIFSND